MDVNLESRPRKDKALKSQPRESRIRLLPITNAYLEVKELAVAPVDGLCGTTGPRDSDDVDLQGGTEEISVNHRGVTGLESILFRSRYWEFHPHGMVSAGAPLRGLQWARGISSGVGS